MSLLIVHTRWAAGSGTQFERLTALLAEDGVLPDGCRSRQLRRQGNALFGTEVWTDDGARQTRQDLADVLDLAGLGRPTHTAMFAVPDLYAAPYLRAGRRTGEEPEEPPRQAPDRRRPSSAGLPRQRSGNTEPAHAAG